MVTPDEQKDFEARRVPFQKELTDICRKYRIDLIGGVEFTDSSQVRASETGEMEITNKMRGFVRMIDVKKHYEQVVNQPKESIAVAGAGKQPVKADAPEERMTN